jgi:hypothetical protein
VGGFARLEAEYRYGKDTNRICLNTSENNGTENFDAIGNVS